MTSHILAFARGRIGAHARVPCVPPADLRTTAERAAWREGYVAELRDPIVERRTALYPKQLRARPGGMS